MRAGKSRKKSPQPGVDAYKEVVLDHRGNIVHAVAAMLRNSVEFHSVEPEGATGRTSSEYEEFHDG
jgi:hypothetical protein